MHGLAHAQPHQVHTGREAASLQREGGQGNVSVGLPAGQVRLSWSRLYRERFNVHQNPRAHKPVRR